MSYIVSLYTRKSLRPVSTAVFLPVQSPIRRECSGLYIDFGLGALSTLTELRLTWWRSAARPVYEHRVEKYFS